MQLKSQYVGRNVSPESYIMNECHVIPWLPFPPLSVRLTTYEDEGAVEDFTLTLMLFVQCSSGCLYSAIRTKTHTISPIFGDPTPKAFSLDSDD